MRAAARGRFDAAYYERFYRTPATRAISPRSAARRARFVAAYLDVLELRVRRVVDLGCGPGYFLRALARGLPGARCIGVETSRYLCRRYGFIEGSADAFVARTPFDLVICDDVVQYLDDSAAARAIENFGRLSRMALWFAAPTREEWRDGIDRQRTDARVHLRPAAWYSRRLAREFVHLGSRLYVKPDVEIRPI